LTHVIEVLLIRADMAFSTEVCIPIKRENNGILLAFVAADAVLECDRREQMSSLQRL
jgi:hypothetical protein